MINSTKVLRVLIDDKLKWTAHIQCIKNKLSKSIGIIYKCRKYFDKETMQNLYFSYIYLYLIYCLEIFGNACNIHLASSLSLKKYICTITYSSYLEHTQPLFNSLTLSDPGYFRQLTIRGGGFKSPPPYDLENYCVNLHHIIHVNFSRCFWHDPIEIF